VEAAFLFSARLSVRIASMTKQTVLIAIAAALAGFIGGFMLANSLNRSDMAARTIPAQPAAATPNPAEPTQGTTLTPDEIKTRVAAADADPKNFSFQKNLGLSLYRYASLKQDSTVLPDAIKIMQRALDLDPEDRDLQIGLGNAHFDVGYFEKDNAAFERARVFYNKALTRLPSDVDVRSDLALTYFLQSPPDLNTAVTEFEKGLSMNGKHERSLQFLIHTYVKQGEKAKATQTLDRLKTANPSSPAIGELTAMIAGEPGSNTR
jgi:tetratricopeptide (TPR) repeat protein